MADLIDRQALVAAFLEYPRVLRHYGDFVAVNLDAVLVEIRRAPAVDAVEVVRCGKCKHWLKDVAGCSEYVGRCEWAGYFVGANGYCVYGERREA